MTEWIDTGSGGGYAKGETDEQRARRLNTQIVEDHTPAEPGDPCPVCEVVDCEERRLARFRMILGPGGSIPPT